MPIESLLTDKDFAVLRTVGAAAAPPGTIVADFDKLLAVLEKDGIPVSPKTREFGIASLPALNAQLSEPAAIGLARGRQTSYPHIDGLHLLLRQTGVARLDVSKSTARLVLDHEKGAQWAVLNPTERYFALLEAWWNPAGENAEWAVVRMTDYLLNLLEMHPPGRAKKAQDTRQVDAIIHFIDTKNVALAQMFGMLDIKQAPPATSAAWKIAQMQATPWGLAASRCFWTACRQANRWLCNEQDTEESDEIAIEGATAFDYWSAAIKPYFPNWTQTFDAQKSHITFHGSITFKVSLGDAWRRIEMSGEHDFSQLAALILDAFDFDQDHLYLFDYQDEYGEKRSLEDPRCEDVFDRYADEVLLGELSLYPKQIITFRYDFGDDWRFKLVVEKLDPTQSNITPKVIDEAGKAPKQY